MAPYPEHLVSDVVLRDGSTVRIRPARPEDETRVEDYLIGLSPENHRMINVFRQSGFKVSIRATPGSIDVEFPVMLTDEAIAQFEQRETQAAVSAMRTFLSPSSVAVIGASRDPTTIGGQLF